MAKISGGGIQSNKLVSVGQRLGSPSKGMSPAAADQIGAATAFKKGEVDAVVAMAAQSMETNSLLT